MSARAIITSQSLRSAVMGPVAVGRNFSFTTCSRLGLKESANGADYDKHKADSLAKQKQGKGHWKPELASDSEEAIRADRDHTPSSPGETAKLQEQTKRAAEETAKAGTSTRDSM
ncbi:unnamed protein product [Clonostachys byssicola]|uniref:Mitochondrial carrier protein pet8 n=1 Tax=Clonostachys byssicola TaxID=160290 RepID=A0A9N9XX51_9HYPO|nr:unnamed protein product [Clonostachys byssicola]